MESFGFYAQALPDVIYQSGSAPWSAVYQRFHVWRDDSTFDQLLERLHSRLNQEGLIDLDTWMIDSTAVRATRASSGAGKKGGRKNR